jgi:uncharacterized protein (TIGR00369 family)
MRYEQWRSGYEGARFPSQSSVASKPFASRAAAYGETRVSEESTLTALLQESPFQQLFDLSCTRLERTTGEVEIAMGYTPSVERSTGTRQYHGGAIASLIDIAGDYALWAVLGFGVPTINIRIDYLRPAAATRLRAQARVRKAGRTVGVVDIDVLDDQDRLVAVGRGTYGTKEG